MTREEAKSKASIRIQLFDAKGANKIIDQIYDDHEAEIKLASDVYSTDKMHMYQELKAKDDEIRRLNNLYADTIKDLGDALIEIERLKGKTQILEVLVDNTKDIIEAQTRMCRTKARSIVAMLFWEWRKSEARIYATNIKWNTGRAFQSQILFEAAYKILKEQQ